MFFMQSYFDFICSEMNLQVFSISEFVADITLLELRRRKQRVKMLRFTLKLSPKNCVRLTLDSYVIKGE